MVKTIGGVRVQIENGHAVAFWGRGQSPAITVAPTVPLAASAPPWPIVAASKSEFFERLNARIR